MTRPHTLVVLVEDHPGVLNRVVSLLRRRSFNINTITVGQSEQPGVSRMTLVVVGDDAEVEQAGKQLYKLMEVLKVTDVTDQFVVAHEMVMVKVATKQQNRAEILLIGQIFNARVIDASPSTLLLEATGPQDQMESFLAMVRPFGIRELVRTGPIAMVRGAGAVGLKGVGKGDRPLEGSVAAD
ncbi:MAG: acetolactate synthase small subunit [Thermomicrobiales bacterium]